MYVGLPERVRLGAFDFDLKAGELHAGTRKITLQEQPFQVLRMLVERRGEVVTRDEIKKKLWPHDTVVEFDHSIQTAISKLRQTLGDSADHPKYIETVARRGYRLIMKVEWQSDSSSDSALAPDKGVLNDPSAVVEQGPPRVGNLIGKKVSHYRVLDILGGGGMGVVYKAEDLKLGRQVALKFLPEELGNNAKALERFEREARAASALDHPNICAIHEFGEHDGQPFIVMPLLQGQNLRDLIAARRAPLSTAEILNIGIQITNGLEAAHEKGIIHRDIKPANIFVTDRGEVRILDFGLAKLAEDVAMSGQDPLADAKPVGESREHRINLDPFLSRTGVAIGTAGYMSPEQVLGERLDARTDLFSFGLVLYEMATGQRAFSGKSGPNLTNAIQRVAPTAARQVNPDLPASLDKILTTALEKDRQARYQSAIDIRADLVALQTKMAPKHVSWRWTAASTAATLLIAAGTIVWYARHRPSPTQVLPDIKFRQLTINSSDNPVTSGSIAHDGKYLAYVDALGIHVKNTETGATKSISAPEALKDSELNWEIISAGWLPDNISFIANAHPINEEQDAWSSRTSSIWKFSRLGGVPEKIRDHAVSWSVSPDGSLVSFGTNPSKLGECEIGLMAPDGSQARKLFTADEGTALAGTWWSPDGKSVLIARTDASGDTIQSRDVHGGVPVTVFTPAELKRERGDIVWLPDGRLIYQLGDTGSGFTSVRDTCNFWAMRLDALTGKPIEKPRRLTNWTGFCISSANATADGKRLAFLASSSSSHGTAYIADMDAGGTRLLNRRHFTLDEGDDFILDWTRDSKAAIVGHNRGDHYELYKQPLDGGAPEPIVTAVPGGIVEGYVVSPDGKWVIVQVWPVSDNPSRLVPIVRVPITGGSPEELFRVSEVSLISCAKAPSNLCTVADRSDDRKEMIITTFDPVKGRGHELARFEIDPNMDLSHYLQGRASPDGTHLLAVRGPTGPIEIRSLRGGPTQIIHPKGVDNILVAGWAADGNGLFLTNRTKDGSEILHMDLHGNTKLLWKSNNKSYGGACGGVPSPDGRHLAIYDLQQSANMWMMENF